MNKAELIAIELLENITGMCGLSDEVEMDLFDAGFLDSLSIITVIVAVEEKVGLRLGANDIKRENISSVKNLALFLAEKGVN